MEKTSRTKKKKAAEDLQKMGEQLVALDDAQLGALHLPADLKAAINETRRLKSRGAYRRQLQYIGRLMRNYDTHLIREALQRSALEKSEKRRRFKIAERWRKELLAGDAVRLTWLRDNLNANDQQQLSHLVDCARGVSAQMSAKEAARRLFRFLFNHLDQFIHNPIHE